MFKFISLVLIVFCMEQCVCPPVVPEVSTEKPVAPSHVNDTLENDPILSLEYHKYLKEVVNLLETDPSFKKLIENASADDIKSGKIASQLQFVHHNVRSKLDELKRKEIERLRDLISRKAKLHNLEPHDIQGLLPKHIDHNNVETFEENDLETLIKQASNDLEEHDRIRRGEFKEHEIEKEFERRKNLQHMDEQARQRAELEHAKAMEARKHHEKVNHPGSKDQLEEVWEEQDQLEPEKFEPHTFFQLHDIDGNSYLDEFEIEALFQIELDKIFNASAPEYDPAEREEEANRMREHVFSEIDKNRDKMISMDEFIAATEDKEFKKNEEWKDVEDEPQFNDQEFDNFSKAHMNEEHTTLTTPLNIVEHHQ